MSDVCQRPKRGGDTWARDPRSWICGRELTTDEQKAAGLCGPHLAGKKRSDQANAAYRAEREASEAAKRSTVALCARLDAIGVRSQPHYESGGNRIGRYTGGVVIAAECATKAVETLEAARKAGGAS